MSENNKTPYQGKRRCFGEYYCPGCNRQWSSANSWADTAQMCTSCQSRVFPKKQHPLEKSNRPRDNEKSHLQHLCDKCIRLGRFCGNYREE